MTKIISNITSASLVKNRKTGMLYRWFFLLIDKIIGIDRLRKFYLKNNLAGLEKQDLTSKLIEKLGVSVDGKHDVLKTLPESGGCIVVCNHPYGMVEGVILANLISDKRRDTKVMANVRLKIFKEIEDYFIFSDPLKPKSTINVSGIKQCFKHVEAGGILVIFPAGRVSFYQEKTASITDAEWNRISVQIARKNRVPIFPIFISGSNSKLFHLLGRVYYRFRLLMLVREMLKLEGKEIKLKSSGLISYQTLDIFTSA